MSRPEILAPAGSMEALTAALRCGADAVYIGGKSYSARQHAANFGTEEIQEASRLCHLYGARLHLAVNTLLTDTELSAFQDYIRQIAPYVDACIVQDLGVLRVLRETLPEMPLHASTQMSIHSPSGALAAKALGCSRVVAAREMSKTDLQALCALPVEVEAFVHGALCMSVSGQCSFSALVGGRSANRGECAQACRLPWSVRPCRAQDTYALSLKDLSLVEHAQELAEIGVDSFKIEGRMKRPEYVAAAVTALRKALDGQQPDLERLQAVFSRSGFTDGYFTGQKQKMFGWRRKEDVLAGSQVLGELEKLYAQPRKVDTLHFRLILASEKPSELHVADTYGDTARLYGDIPEIPQKSPLTQELVSKSMQKLGGTVYTCGSVTLENPDRLFLSSAQCNALRRKAVEAVDCLRIGAMRAEYIYVSEKATVLPCCRTPQTDHIFRLHIRTGDQLAAALRSGEIVCVPLSLAEQCSPAENVLIESPRILENEEDYRKRLFALRERGFSHLICHNLADIRLGNALGFALHGGFGLNVTNRLTALSLHEMGLQDICASTELRSNRIADLAKVLPVSAIVYGRLPMMLYRVCPIKAQDGCHHHNCSLTDRTGRQFPLLCSGNYQELVNAEILWLAGRDFPAEYHDFCFTDETPERMEQVLQAYQNGAGTPPQARTSGLYYKGGLQ